VRRVNGLLLAAGIGERLMPLTKEWPKCLMPIGRRALLEYWLETLFRSDVRRVRVNIHHHASIVERFLNRSCFSTWVDSVFEPELLGTAGTIRANREFFSDHTVLLAHADNWCQCDLDKFMIYHFEERPSYCPMTMMTFDTTMPSACGVVTLNSQGVVQSFHEKVAKPPGNLASGAVYLIEPEVVEWIEASPEVKDFSTEVIPAFMGRIATWHNDKIHRDIGTIESLRLAQTDPSPIPLWLDLDEWQMAFRKNPIHFAVR